MANKFRKHRKNNFNLQDEPVMSRPRMTIEDRPRTDNAERFMRNHGNISFKTRTQVGTRISNGFTGLTQNDVMENLSTHRLRDDSRAENEFMNGRITRKKAMENQPNHQSRENHGVGNEFMNGSFEQENEEGSANGSEIMEKETRGPTYMQNIWGRAPNLPLLHVEYNEYGQPIGGEYSKLCHFLGSIARNDKYCPIDVKNWHSMPKTKKNDILDVVKLRFHVPIIAEKWILTSVGNKWRNWKHTLKTKYWCDNVPIEHLIEERDERVSVDQWVKLLTYWRTEEAKKTSQRNEKARGKKTMNQRTGKTSFAQIKAKMTKEKGRCPTRVELFNSCFVPSNGTSSDAIMSKYSAMLERSNQLSEDFNDVIGPDDVFAQIMGKDTSGHVRMFGQGVCPKDVWSETPRSTSNRLLMEHQEKIAHLENMLLTQQKSCASQVNSGHTSTFNSLSPNAPSTIPLQAGQYVSLKSLFNPKKNVAEGYVYNTDPSTKVGGQLLGVNWCGVNVKVIVEPEEQLIRPYDNLQKISQTVGAMVAWPCYLVTPTEEF